MLEEFPQPQYGWKQDKRRISGFRICLENLGELKNIQLGEANYQAISGSPRVTEVNHHPRIFWRRAPPPPGGRQMVLKNKVAPQSVKTLNEANQAETSRDSLGWLTLRWLLDDIWYRKQIPFRKGMGCQLGWWITCCCFCELRCFHHFQNGFLKKPLTKPFLLAFKLLWDLLQPSGTFSNNII